MVRVNIILFIAIIFMALATLCNGLPKSQHKRSALGSYLDELLGQQKYALRGNFETEDDCLSAGKKACMTGMKCSCTKCGCGTIDRCCGCYGCAVGGPVAARSHHDDDDE